MSCKAATAALAVLLLVSTVAQGQRPGRFRGRDWRRATLEVSFLVQLPEVQKELELTSQQEQLLDALLDDLQDQSRAMFGGPGGPPGVPGGRSGTDSVGQQIETLTQQGEELINALLEPNQAVRLRQLRLQRQGTAALVRPEIVQALSLEDEQLAKIRQMLSAEAAVEEARLPIAARQQRATEQIVDAQVSAVLSDQQRQIWENMKGKPFEFREASERFGRRGPLGRRGPRNGE